MMGTPAAKSTMKVLSDLLRRLDRGSTGTKMSVEEALAGATSKLSDEEKDRLDGIVTELASRILRRVRTRVGGKKPSSTR
jgi:hypothetical protein